MNLKNKKSEILIVWVIIMIQTIVFIIVGMNKSYIHMDEAYSLGLASYDKTEIQENEDFYNTWHSKEYYSDYLEVDSDEQDFLPVYENQKNDVHPPLYYLLLRIAMGFHTGSFSKWSGIILNIIIYGFITIFIYLIIKKMLGGNIGKSAILALISSLTLASISNVIYIRMYALLTLNIVATTYFHLKLLDKKTNYKTLLPIGIFALAGSLTHYYYLFFLAMLVFMFSIKYFKEKDYKGLAKYLGTIILAGVLSLVIFPYSIKHIFFGYRGKGVLSNFSNISKFLISILEYIFIVNVYNFNNALFIILIFMLGLFIYKKIKKSENFKPKNKYIKYIAIPTIFYAILVSIVSPYITLRYIMPVSNLIFVLIIYGIIQLSKNIFKENTLNKILMCIYLLIFIMPFATNKIIDLAVGEKCRKEQETSYSSKSEIAEKLKEETNLPINIISNFTDMNLDDVLLYIKDFKLEPEVLYSNKKKITNLIKENSELPALYMFDSNHNRFLDDILLFANINESYVAKDIEYTEENIQRITLGKNTSNGILLFINDGQNNDEILKVVKKALNLDNTIYLERLDSCDVYLVNKKSNKIEENNKEIFAKYYEQSEEILQNMTLEEKIGQMFLARFPVSGVIEEIKNYNPGGYILFARDFKNETKSSMFEKLQECQDASKIKLILGVDEEGGSVVRVSSNPAFYPSKFLSPQALWKIGGLPAILEDSTKKSNLLKSIGLNMNLTPIADVPTKTSSFIYNRSFGKSAEETAVYISQLIKTMNNDNMISAMKHFPGYGDNVDTHNGIAIDERDYSEFENSDFLPFKSGIEEKAPCILVSHTIVKSMDENKPASLSEKVHNILRNELNFSGIIMTDDLAMDAVKNYVGSGEAAIQAVLAGNDIIISSNFVEQKQEILNAVNEGRIPEELINKATKRILAMKIMYEII